MQLKEFADALRNIENDRMIMSYGNNAAVVGSILSVVDLVQSLSRVMRQDRQSDMFSMNVSNQLMQFESSVIMFGMQRLSQNGINLPPQLSPYGQQPMYNQPAYNPNMMYSGAPSFGGMTQQYQQQYQQQPQYQAPQQPQYQQQPQAQPQYQAAPPPQPAPAPPPQVAPAPAPAPKPAPKPVINDDDDDAPQAKPIGGNKGASMNLPGMGGGGDEKAAGRDYLLQLLGDKE
ncbi:MAG: hypothetical protein LBN07_05205 [Christensenellaceae bacterium]|jgi:hypothetical protein|nr:hypothetical protein [Christensenellaceae bacterium]